MSVDPLASKYPAFSPYNYVLNNPLNNFDPDGKEVLGLQFGGEVTYFPVSVSFNIAVTFDTRGNNWNLLGSGGYGVGVGKGANANVGVIVGETFTRTSDLIGDGTEGSVDLSLGIKGGGYAWSASKDANGKETGRGAHIWSWSPGVGAAVKFQKTTTIDVIESFKHLWLPDNNSKKSEENNNNDVPDWIKRNLEIMDESTEAGRDYSDYLRTRREMINSQE